MEHITIDEYINKLKSSSPTPGGGSANCQLAKISISLALMSINVSKNRKSFENYTDKERIFVEGSIGYLENALKELDEKAENDEKVFNNFMIAYKEKDQEKIAKASIECYSCPLNMLLLCFGALDVIFSLEKYVVSTIMSDYKMSLRTMSAVLENGIFNLDINVKNLKDKQLININSNVHAKCKECVKKINKVLRRLK